VDEPKPNVPASLESAGAAPRAPSGDEAHAPERQRTIDALCEAFANDELEVEEFERRVETAHRAASSEELRRLLNGLPSASVPAPVPKKGQSPHPAPSTGATPTPYMGEVREWSFSLGVMGGTSRSGYWVPARKNVAIGVMGGCEVDLRDASLPPGVTEIIAVAFWGGVEIIVPPWLHVETSGIGLMGGFDHHQDVPSTGTLGGPLLRISGLALMGGVEVAVRYPGESARDARRRVKEERKGRRLAGGKRHDAGEGE
jgi:hypothetical protein